MAYLDATGATSEQRLTAIGATTLVNGGLAAAVIFGLTMGYSDRVPVPNPTATWIPHVPIDPPAPDPKDIEEDVIEKKVRSDIEVIDRPFDFPDDSPVKKPFSDPADDRTPNPTGKDDNTAKKPDIPKPPPADPPAPPPIFVPKAPVPLNNASGWVTPNDYPLSELRRNSEGTARFILSVSSAGKVTRCEITQSSGHSRLDRATCAKVKRRARFKPATDENGADVAGTFSSAVRWEIPE